MKVHRKGYPETLHYIVDAYTGKLLHSEETGRSFDLKAEEAVSLTETEATGPSTAQAPPYLFEQPLDSPILADILTGQITFDYWEEPNQTKQVRGFDRGAVTIKQGSFVVWV